MKYWLTKEFATLANVSVKTLHHYDKIGLLSPSCRSEKGYRHYSEKDLFKLQQIVALKSFGFELSKIQTLLGHSEDMHEMLSLQHKLLKAKAQRMLDTASFIEDIIQNKQADISFDWHLLIKLLEVFTMTQHLENKWVADVLEGEELKQYAEFEKSKINNTSSEKRQAFELEWSAIVEEVKRLNGTDPTADIAISLGKRTMDLINPHYGKENMNLRNKIWHEGFKKGKNKSEHGMTAEMSNWLDQAIDAYWRQRIFEILNQVSSETDLKPLSAWSSLLDEMCGSVQEDRKHICDLVLESAEVPAVVKQWINANSTKM